jgi:hypothetical protein
MMDVASLDHLPRETAARRGAYAKPHVRRNPSSPPRVSPEQWRAIRVLPIGANVGVDRIRSWE